MIKAEKKISKEEQLNRLVKYIKSLMDSNSFLTLRVSFENGNIVNIKIEKNIKIHEVT
jgi:hypothetical protein